MAVEELILDGVVKVIELQVVTFYVSSVTHHF